MDWTPTKEDLVPVRRRTTDFILRALVGGDARGKDVDGEKALLSV